MCENQVPWLFVVYSRPTRARRAASLRSRWPLPWCAGPEGAFTVGERDRALASLADDLATLIIVEFTPDITADARALLLRHRLRAGDAVQLASCLYLQREMSEPLPFVVFDDRLAEAARHEGLTVVPVSKGRR